ncbi:MAG: hypothetical protein ACON5N_18050 [Akkermansiaceae bacterium]
MNKNHLHHLIWAAVAAGAFFVGSRSDSAKADSSASSSRGSSGNAPPLSSRQSATTSPDNSNTSGVSSTRQDGTLRSLSSVNLSEQDIARLGEEFRSAKGPIARRLAFSELLKGMTPENAKLMREQIAHMPQDSPEFREFHYAWGSMAGEEAVLHGKDTPKRDMAATLAGWASSNPDAAIAYFDTLSPEEQNGGTHMKWGAAFGLADADPNLAAQFAADRHADGDKDAGRMIHIAAGAVFRGGDPEAAKDWARNVPEGPLQGEATARVANEISKQDPQEAISWAQTLPDGDSKNRAIGSSFSTWAGKDPEAAAAQISTLSGPEKDAATYGYATRVAHDDPAVGVEWASTISDENSRHGALVDTGRTFFRKNPEAASQWLPNSGLPADVQAKITSAK